MGKSIPRSRSQRTLKASRSFPCCFYFRNTCSGEFLANLSIVLSESILFSGLMLLNSTFNFPNIKTQMNNWGIPEWLELEVKQRDKVCVYCGVLMIEVMPSRGPRKNVATWEHIIKDASIISRENIARCCVACNSSKGSKRLSDWIHSKYCKRHGIGKYTVAEVIREALRGEAINYKGPSENL